MSLIDLQSWTPDSYHRFSSSLYASLAFFCSRSFWNISKLEGLLKDNRLKIVELTHKLKPLWKQSAAISFTSFVPNKREPQCLTQHLKNPIFQKAVNTITKLENKNKVLESALKKPAISIN